MALPHIVCPADLAGISPAEQRELTDTLLLEHGAVLFRGFGLSTPEAFEALAFRLDDGLQEVYRGTAPRNSQTKHVYSSTELASNLPIPQHLEMSFLPGTPRRLFFYCHVAPAVNGETPIADFKAVYNDLDREIIEAFDQKGITHIRNYNPPGRRFELDISKLKSWDQVYRTNDMSVIEEKCKRENQQFEFSSDRSLRLINSGPAYREHPETGDRIWFNHAQVFHPEGPVLEAAYIARRQGGLRQTATAWFLRAFYKLTTPFLEDNRWGTQVTFGDGSPIPRDWIRRIQEVIWDNLVFFSWQQGDVLALDNLRVAHGRMPFKGPRKIMVAWTD